MKRNKRGASRGGEGMLVKRSNHETGPEAAHVTFERAYRFRTALMSSPMQGILHQML